ncbi:hypothetical protein ACGFSB_16480 [Streptomyces sp. NPDC048441]|uniref:hypothetical protein n=1 Tax=Streptomyces sp. NPDC048441 TaxID=3365552 RepID=UPI00371FA270
MADEDYRWLDRDAAERLLSGEPFDGTDHHARERAAHLAKALAALAADDRAGSVVPADISSELPGEAAAMAAFRQARGPSAGAASTRVGAGRTVAIGRTAEPPRQARWARPVRFGLAAVLAGCMIGGVAVAAGTGVLPSPFGGHDKPGPAASASSVASPEPLASPSGGESSAPDVEPDDVTSAPDDSSHEPGSSAPPQDTEGTSKDTAGGATHPGSDGSQRDDEAAGLYSKVVKACRDYRSGELQGEKRRRLEEAAKGPQRVTEFCGRVLDGSGSGSGQNSGSGGSGGSGDDGDGGDGGDDGKDDGASGGGNNHEGNGGGGPVPPIASPTVPQATPTASYSAQPELPTTATVSPTGS